MKVECEPYAAWLLDERAPKPVDFDAHVVGCADCTALREAHWRALALKGTHLPAAPRVRAPQVVHRASLVAAVVAFIGIGVMTFVDRPPPVVAERPSTSLGELEPLRAHATSLEGLAQLNQTVVRYARVDPVAHGYGPHFGSLPQLFAPSPVTQEYR